MNRIVNKSEELRIIELLREHKQLFVHLPFKLDEYAEREFRFEDYHVPDIVHSKDFRGYKVYDIPFFQACLILVELRNHEVSRHHNTDI